MAVRIRLSRGGSKKRPFYRIVAADQRSPRDGRFIERLGTYNPLLPKEHAERIVLVEDRIKHWLSVGSQPTDRVAKILSEKGLLEKPAVTEQTKKCQPRPKTVEKMKQKEENLKAKAEAEAKAKEENSSETETA